MHTVIPTPGKVLTPSHTDSLRLSWETNHATPHYTTKFSLGNGPHEWVKEYLINRESGKMLGTLVALALERMPLLQDFTHIEWPNFSVLPALRSLNVLNIDEIAYLEEMSVLIERSMAKLRVLRIGLAHKVAEDGFASTRDLDFPTVDEEPTEYEHALRRLMSKLLKVEEHDCPKSSDSNFLPSPGARTHVEPHSHLGSKNLTINPCPTVSPGHIVSNQTSDDRTNLPGDVLQVVSKSDPAAVLATLVIKDQVNTLANKSTPSGIDALAASSSSAAPDGDISHGFSATAPDPLTKISSLSSDHTAKQNRGDEGDCNDAKMATSAGEEGLDRTHQKKRLRLEILELESIHVLFDVLLDTINWSTLTTLTLLHCDSSEGLWRALRRAFTPRPIASQPVLRRKSKMHLGELSSKDLLRVPPSEYQLSLRRIHTNTVSPALIAFLRETLAPDSLEWLFLQDAGMVSNSTGGRGSYDSNVSVEAIFHGPLRRHRHSLKKLMIDSDDRPVNSRRKTAKWHKWKVDRNLLAFVTSGKMSALREMAISIDYKDWHFFLQRLPQVPHIRSLYLRHGADHPHEQHFNPKELALQVMDIVSIRPEMELCYLGIASKCFEILEGDDEALAIHQSPATAANTGPNDASTDEDSDDGENGDTAEGDHEGQTAHAPEDSDADSQPESVEFSDDEATELDGRAKIPRLELREILFYDDKISIFKARHAKL
ncbi:MAG: hypothetical protein Q9193_001871 [Seirophora villosa]